MTSPDGFRRAIILFAVLEGLALAAFVCVMLWK